MGLQAIEVAPKENPVFLMDQDTGDMTTAHWAVLQDVSSQREGASIAFSPTQWLPRVKTLEGSRRTSRVVTRAFVAVGVCVLWLFIEASWDNGLCGESNIGAQSFDAPTDMERKIAQPNAMRNKSLLVPRVAETTPVEQKQILRSVQWAREKSDILSDRLKPTQQPDAAQGKAAQAPQAVPAWGRKPALEYEQEFDSAEVLARALTSSLREELDELRSMAEAARIKQKQALEQERGRADALARELTSLWAELDAAGIAGSEAVKTAEAERKQKQALKQEQDRAEGLTRELSSLRAELDAARNAGQEAARAAEVAKTKQEQALKDERDRGEALGRELTSLRAELDAARAAGQEAARTAEAAKEVEQELAFGKERDRSETLARELASARKEVEERSALLAAAHAEVLHVTETNRAFAAEQKLALASERERADALTRELTSVRNELEAGNRQIAALNALRAGQSCESAVDSSQERMGDSSSGTTEGKGRSPEQISAEAAASTSGQSSASELPRPEAQSTAREAASDLGPNVAMGIERSTSATTASSRSLVDEQRLLARANALLRQADISGARLLLERALERGSARAAFMLAETYDARMLRSWRTLGISGDLTKARELYERAQAGGIEDAKERIETLK
jgi:hypothetical protein